MRVTSYLAKKNCSGQMSQFEPENGTSHNSGSALRIFFRFCTMKRADMYMEIMSIAFPKNSSSGQMSHSGPKMVHPHNSGSAAMIFILHNERGQERNGNYSNGFSGKNLTRSNLVISAHKWYALITLDLLSGFF